MFHFQHVMVTPVSIKKIGKRFRAQMIQYQTSMIEIILSSVWTVVKMFVLPQFHFLFCLTTMLSNNRALPFIKSLKFRLDSCKNVHFTTIPLSFLFDNDVEL